MFANLTASIKARINAAITNASLAAAAGVAAIPVVIFLIMAGYIWLAQKFSPLLASLIMAGVFAVIVILLVVLLKLKQSQQEKERIKRAAEARRSPLLDPAVLTMGMQTVKSASRNQPVLWAVLGSLAIGFLLSRVRPPPPEDEA